MLIANFQLVKTLLKLDEVLYILNTNSGSRVYLMKHVKGPRQNTGFGMVFILLFVAMSL